MPWGCWGAHRPLGAGAHLDLPAIQSALKRGGRTQYRCTCPRNPGRATLEQLAAPAPVAAAFGATTRAAVGIIAELNRQIR